MPDLAYNKTGPPAKNLHRRFESQQFYEGRSFPSTQSVIVTDYSMNETQLDKSQTGASNRKSLMVPADGRNKTASRTPNKMAGMDPSVYTQLKGEGLN